jgi:hypothetical protein
MLLFSSSSCLHRDANLLRRIGEYAGGIVLDEKSGAPRQLSLDERLALRHLAPAHVSPAYEALARWILLNP